MLKPAEERFWSQVEFTETCWLWTGSKSGTGYGGFSDSGKRWPAHRWAYEYLVGPIPDGLVLDHLCRNPPCVRFDHLEPVTERENILRGVGASAQNARKTHCKQGHPYDETNTRLQPHGNVVYRKCRQCQRLIDQRSLPRRIAARREAREATRVVARLEDQA